MNLENPLITLPTSLAPPALPTKAVPPELPVLLKSKFHNAILLSGRPPVSKLPENKISGVPPSENKLFELPSSTGLPLTLIESSFSEPHPVSLLSVVEKLKKRLSVEKSVDEVVAPTGISTGIWSKTIVLPCGFEEALESLPPGGVGGRPGSLALPPSGAE